MKSVFVILLVALVSIAAASPSDAVAVEIPSALRQTKCSSFCTLSRKKFNNPQYRLKQCGSRKQMIRCTRKSKGSGASKKGRKCDCSGSGSGSGPMKTPKASYKPTPNPPRPPREVSIICGQKVFSRGDNFPTTYKINMFRPSGYFNYSYTFYPVPDRMQIYYEEEELVNTGFVTGSGGSTNVLYGGKSLSESNLLTVYITPATEDATAWDFTISCPLL